MKVDNVLFSSAIAAGLIAVMIGCAGDGINEPLDNQLQPESARMVASYSPKAGILPLPNDVLFKGSLDLTLNIPVDDAENYADPKVALSGLDGWSAVAPFAINFASRDENLTLDASSVVGGSSVHFYKVNVIRPEVAAGVIAPTGIVTSVIEELAVPADYVVQASGKDSIAIVPTRPLEAQATYMVVLTNALQDSDGLAILRSGEYAIAQSRTPIDPESSVFALEGLRVLINAMEDAAAAATNGPALNEIILSYQFTVQSIGVVQQTAKAVYIDGAIAAGATPTTSFTSLGTDTGPFTGIGAADLYKGSIVLNYMLGVPSEENPVAPLNTFWRTAANVPNGQGGWVANPDPLGNLTYANPLPQINAQETVPLLVSMPKVSLCPKPAAGYPVVIFQHGITSNRTSLLGIADSLAAPPSCRAAVSMDMPLHGLAEGDVTGLFEGYASGGVRERTFGVDYVNNVTGLPGADTIADASGTHMINLSHLLVTRDNSRQASFDLLYLEKAIVSMDIDGGGVDFDASQIGFIGHSLGGMVGVGLLAYSDNIKAAALANSGGGTSLMLNGSASFGPRIRAGIAGAAGVAVDDPAFPGILAAFLFAAQTTIDASDPVNIATLAVANDVPTLLLQVLNDAVVPNSVATAPLAGTEPLSRALGLTDVTAEQAGFVAGDRLFTKLLQGIHKTALTPAVGNDPVGLLAVTTEIQTQIVSFLSSVGAGVQVVDPALLEAAPVQ